MKKLIAIIIVLFTMTACGQNSQEYASVDNKNTTKEIDGFTKKYSSDSNISPEIKKLKAEFMREIKQQYFIDRGLKVPRSLEIILMSDVYGSIYTYFTFDGKMSGARKVNGRISAPGGFIKNISSMHKDVDKLIYQK